MSKQEQATKTETQPKEIFEQEFTGQKKPVKTTTVVLFVLVGLVLTGFIGYEYGINKTPAGSIATETSIMENTPINVGETDSQIASNIPSTPLSQVLDQYCEVGTGSGVPLSVLPFALSSSLKSKYGLTDKINCYCEGEMGGCVDNSYYLQTESPGIGSMYFVSADSNSTGGVGLPFFEEIAFPNNHLSTSGLQGGNSTIADALSQPIAEKTGVVITVSSGPGDCEIHFPLEVTAYGHKLSPDGKIIATVSSHTYEVGNPYWMVSYNDHDPTTTSGQISNLLDESLTDCVAEKFYVNNGCYADGKWTCGADVPDSAGWARSLKPGVSKDEFSQKLQTLIAQLPIYTALQEEVTATLQQITF
jgi:hypothetical protein